MGYTVAETEDGISSMDKGNEDDHLSEYEDLKEGDLESSCSSLFCWIDQSILHFPTCYLLKDHQLWHPFPMLPSTGYKHFSQPSSSSQPALNSNHLSSWTDYHRQNFCGKEYQGQSIQKIYSFLHSVF